jgi:hypothetical protein
VKFREVAKHPNNEPYISSGPKIPNCTCNTVLATAFKRFDGGKNLLDAPKRRGGLGIPASKRSHFFKFLA